MKKIVLITALVIIIISSCRQIHFVDGEAMVLNRSIDTTLNDSAMIFGTVYRVGCDQCVETQAKIWINGTALFTLTDLQGSFNLKIPSGLCTIKCSIINSQYDISEQIKDIQVLKNEKIELKFIMGYVAE